MRRKKSVSAIARLKFAMAAATSGSTVCSSFLTLVAKIIVCKSTNQNPTHTKLFEVIFVEVPLKALFLLILAK